MLYVAPLIEWVGLGVIAGYLGVVAAIMLHYERQHPQTWALMGHPSMLFGSPTVLRLGNWLPIAAILFGLGFVLREKCKLPDDPVITIMLWTARILMVSALVWTFGRHSF